MKVKKENIPTVIRTEDAFILKVPLGFMREVEDWRFVLIQEFITLMTKPEDFIEKELIENFSGKY